MDEDSDPVPYHDTILITQQESLVRCLSGTICLTDRRVEVLVENEFDTANTFVHWKYKGIGKFYNERVSTNVSYGGVTHGAKKVKCLKSFAW